MAPLETELRDTGVVYTCPPGLHDGLGISAPCWRGRQCIRIWAIGPTLLCPRAARASRVKHLAGKPSLRYSPRQAVEILGAQFGAPL